MICGRNRRRLRLGWAHPGFVLELRSEGRNWRLEPFAVSEKAFHRRACTARCAQKFGEEPMKTKSIANHFASLPFTLLILAVALILLASGCSTEKPHFDAYSALPPKDSKDIVLGEGDVVKITFPGADNLDTVQTIRRDGKITLPMVGEIAAAGKTPTALEKELVNLFASQLVSSKDITVTVQSSSFAVYVTGAVAKPGKIISDHPITVLEAVMDSGGPDYARANLKRVRIIRTQNNQTKNYIVNLRGIVDSTPIDVFYLQPSDIVYVPEKMTWF
jgi:polysaccharide biosynthesis/export protein